MARGRRRKTPRSKPVNVKFVVFQIIVLLVCLFALFAVQDTISEGTGVLIDSLASEDIEVQQPVDEAEEDGDFSGAHTDDGAETGPATEDRSDETDDQTRGLTDDYDDELHGDE